LIADVREPFRQQRPAGRQVEDTAVFETKFYRRTFYDVVAKIDPDMRAEVAAVRLILNECDRIVAIFSEPFSSNATERVSSSGVNVTSTVAFNFRSVGTSDTSIT